MIQKTAHGRRFPLPLDLERQQEGGGGEVFFYKPKESLADTQLFILVPRTIMYQAALYKGLAACLYS